MTLISQLKSIRHQTGQIRTKGLDDTVVEAFAQDADLQQAIRSAEQAFAEVKDYAPQLLEMDEDAQIEAVQAGFINFYPQDGVNPYVALAAAGPWIITLKGAVIYDTGGYGMLGFGHTPDKILQAMAKPQVMANVMTANISQLRFTDAIRKEIGHTRGGEDHCPYTHFMCLNSGSESVTLAARIADTNTKIQTDPGATYAGRKTKRLVVKGSFHGRTDRPALYSDSTRKNYVQNLASYRNEDSVIAIAPYDIEALQKVFSEAESNGWFIEAMFLEPVMGEGDPGRSVPPEFYAEARKLTKQHGSLLLVDSIQAGLRAQGVLSIVDYPGFENLEAPDMETYSKALNAGQYPLSVLALNERASAIYKRGTYGNTMTTNPRALDVACAVLESLTPEIRQNIRQRGEEAVQKLNALKDELGDLITKVQGTGLLFSCELAKQFKGYGAGSSEEWLRENGLGVIHGGENSLRFTPGFEITEQEVDLFVGLVRRALLEGPQQKQSEAA